MNANDAIGKIKDLLDSSGLQDSSIAEKIVGIITRLKESGVNFAIQQGLDSLIGDLKSNPQSALDKSGLLNTLKNVFGNASAAVPIKTKIDEADLSRQVSSVFRNAGLFEQKDVENIFSQFQKAAKLAIEKVDKSNLMTGLGKFEDVAGNTAKAGLRTFATSKVQSSAPIDFLNSVEDTLSFSLKKYQSDTTDLFQQKGGISQTTTGREEVMSGLQASASARMKMFGEDSADAIASVKSIISGIDNIENQLGKDFEIKIKDGKVLDAKNALSIFSQELGIGEQALTSYVNFATTRFGTGGEVVEKNLLAMANAAEAAGMPTEKFFNRITEATGEFKDLGDVTQASSEMLARFAQNLGPNKLGAAVDLFKSVSSGVANMNDGMKAFIAMGSDLGGSNNPLDSIINLEEAIASGDQDKIREIQDTAISKIEELTGGSLLTRKEAVDSGQQELFYRQSALSEQMGLTRGRNQFSNFVDATRGGEAVIGNADFSNLAERHLDSQINSRNISSTLANASYGVAEEQMIKPNTLLSRLRKNGASAGLDFFGKKLNIDEESASAKLQEILGFFGQERSAKLSTTQETALTNFGAASLNNANVLQTNSSRLNAGMLDETANSEKMVSQAISATISMPTELLDSFSQINDSINTSNEKYVAKLDAQIAVLTELVSKVTDSKVNITLSPDAEKYFRSFVADGMKDSVRGNQR